MILDFFKKIIIEFDISVRRCSTSGELATASGEALHLQW
jgi:hypothetical protein